MMIEVVSLCQTLIRFPSVTPDSAGCLEYIAGLLKDLGFEIYFLEFGLPPQAVKNLYARYGKNEPHLNFLGHVDVVPTGPLNCWTYPPFDGVINNGRLYGRGTVDMKGAIACFIDALTQVLPFVKGSVSIILTSDEEGPAVNGTQKVVQWLQEQRQIPDFCLVGEPTNPSATDKMIKIGRRGSLTIDIQSQGIQGHVAYPEKALNPINPLLYFLQELINNPLDAGTPEFDPSGLQITTIDCGNNASNIIPQSIKARCNIRFNTLHSAESLMEWIQKTAEPYGLTIHSTPASAPFIVKPGRIHDLLKKCIKKVTATEAVFSTTGGTSDARFMHTLCPLMEFGLMNATMHKIDEHVALDDLHSLKNIYQEFIQQFFLS